MQGTSAYIYVPQKVQHHLSCNGDTCSHSAIVYINNNNSKVFLTTHGCRDSVYMYHYKTNWQFQNHTVVTQTSKEAVITLCQQTVGNSYTNRPERKLAHLSSCTNQLQRKLTQECVYLHKPTRERLGMMLLFFNHNNSKYTDRYRQV